MIELRRDRLVFSFPEVHPDAVMEIEFERTLRIPDDDNTYGLPPGVGAFPLRHVDDYAKLLSVKARERGGVLLPMYQSEAMWLNFISRNDYPFAVKIAAGKINAVTGDAWSDTLARDPQDYMAIPEQPWLDGYCVSKGIIRQFVAMPLGSGYSVEEQLTGETEFGGLQILVHPIKKEVYEKMQKDRESEGWGAGPMMDMVCCESPMGLAAGGRMRQEIYNDPHNFTDWNTDVSARCFVHILNALTWRATTGQEPPTTPPTAAEYTRAGLPWFEYYGGDKKALPGSETLNGVKSVVQLGKIKGDVPLPENETVDPQHVIWLGDKPTVREGKF